MSSSPSDPCSSTTCLGSGDLDAKLNRLIERQKKVLALLGEIKAALRPQDSQEGGAVQEGGD